MDDDDSAMDDDDDSAMDDDDDSAADDDDDSYPDFALSSIYIECSGTRDLETDWKITLDTAGWASNPVLFIWDQYVNSPGDWHFIDAWQPFPSSSNPYEEVDPYFEGIADRWVWNVNGWATIDEASTDSEAGNNATIMDCTGVADDHSYMVCADDFWEPYTQQCWFCGPSFGDAAGSSSEDLLGTVGGFDDGESQWSATDQDAECVFGAPPAPPAD
jgi:hypothetical protein